MATTAAAAAAAAVAARAATDGGASIRRERRRREYGAPDGNEGEGDTRAMAGFDDAAPLTAPLAIIAKRRTRDSIGPTATLFCDRHALFHVGLVPLQNRRVYACIVPFVCIHISRSENLVSTATPLKLNTIEMPRIPPHSGLRH
jgi:hypothetical protein